MEKSNTKTLYISVMTSVGYEDFLYGNEDDICAEAMESGDPDAYLHKNADWDSSEMMDGLSLDYVDYRSIGASEGMITSSTWDIACYDLEWLPVEITDPANEMDEIEAAIHEYYRDMSYNYMSDYYVRHGYGNEE